MQEQYTHIHDFLDRIRIPRVTADQCEAREGELGVEELARALKKMGRAKAPGPDRLSVDR